VIYAYAVCRTEEVDRPPRRRGLGGATLRAATVDGLTAVYSRHRSLRPRPSPEQLWTHERTVEALMTRGAVLPMRFGTVLPDEAALVEALGNRREEFAARLARVGGRVELAVRFFADDPEGRDAGSGRAYLLARVEQHRAAERAARDIHAPLAELASDSRTRPRAAPPTLLAAAYLVDRGDVPAFRAQVERTVARAGVRAVCTGPWPPYSFVEEDDR
jgi:hypothetical protein